MKARALAIAVIAFLGMMDTSYISFKRGGPPVACHVTKGCNDVLTSRFSTLAGIPISWFGLAFYLAVFACAIFALSGSGNLLRLIFWPALFAFLVSLSLTSIQAFVLHAFCEYCMLSAILSTSIFALAAISRKDETQDA